MHYILLIPFLSEILVITRYSVSYWEYYDEQSR